MECQRCHKENAHFTGSSSSYGPVEADAENTPENLPGGYAWLCDECMNHYWSEELDSMGEPHF
jgi:hypothetical protein